MTKKELTKEQQNGINKLAELLNQNPDTADRLTKHLKELSGVEAVAESISLTKLYRPSEIIKILSISRRQLYVLIEAKKIKTVKVGTFQKIIGQDLINFLKREYNI